ncbi:MAG: SIR2 family protein [Bacteroidota bacterium]
MVKLLDDDDWDMILDQINEGKCTPFLGAGASQPYLPLGGDIAERWVEEYKCPLPGCRDLPRVAQFLAVRKNPMFPKNQIVREFFSNMKLPDFDQQDEPHGILADLPLPIYVTTNYDHFMFHALSKRHKNPKLEVCRWNTILQKEKSIFDEKFEPNSENPVVFHLHGHFENAQSLVLTEDDYLYFLVNLEKDEKKLVPSPIVKAFTGSSLLFLGYSLSDWDFRVLFQGIVMGMEKSLREFSISVQLPPGEEQMVNYWEKYLGDNGVKISWGTAREFAAELNRRWKEYQTKR